MDDRQLRELLLRVQALEQRSVKHRLGEVTSVSPLSVALGGSGTAYTSVRAVGGGYAVGDVVSCITFGNDLLVLGLVGDGGPWIPLTNFANGWRAYAGGVDPWQPQVRRVGNDIECRGVIDKNGGNFIANEQILTFPGGFGSATNHANIFPAQMTGGGATGTGELRAVGTALTLGTIGGPANPVTWVALDTVRFSHVV
jgi:hypothetical protein